MIGSFKIEFLPYTCLTPRLKAKMPAAFTNVFDMQGKIRRKSGVLASLYQSGHCRSEHTAISFARRVMYLSAKGRALHLCENGDPSGK